MTSEQEPTSNIFDQLPDINWNLLEEEIGSSLEFSPEATKAIDNIIAKTKVDTRAEVIRNSIAALTWLVDNAVKGYYFVAVREEDDIAKELSMQILDEIRPNKNPQDSSGSN